MEKKPSNRELVAVYGTLRARGKQHWRMAGAIFRGMSEVRGDLYRVSWYPALVLGGEGSGEIVVEVYEVSGDLLRELDEYEGGEYERRRVELEVVGKREGVWIWEWVKGVDDLEVIGEWMFEEDGDLQGR